MNTCFTAIDSLLISWLIFKHFRPIYTWQLGVYTRLSLSHTIIASIAPPNLQWSPYFLVYGWDFWWLSVIFPMSSRTISYIYIIMKLIGPTHSFSLTHDDFRPFHLPGMSCQNPFFRPLHRTPLRNKIFPRVFPRSLCLEMVFPLKWNCTLFIVILEYLSSTAFPNGFITFSNSPSEFCAFWDQKAMFSSFFVSMFPSTHFMSSVSMTYIGHLLKYFMMKIWLKLVLFWY